MTAKQRFEAAQRLELAERFTVFVLPPELVTRVVIEDAWELCGYRRLWVVAETARARAADVLATLAVGHRPELVRADEGADKMRPVVTNTMLQLQAGDVLVIVSRNEAAAREAVAEGMRRRTNRRSAHGERESRVSR